MADLATEDAVPPLGLGGGVGAVEDELIEGVPVWVVGVVTDEGTELTAASQPLRDSAASPAVSDRVVMERLLWGAWIQRSAWIFGTTVIP